MHHPVARALWLLLGLSALLSVHSLRPLRPRGFGPLASKGQRVLRQSPEERVSVGTEKPIIIELVLREERQERREGARIVGAYNVYKEEQPNKVMAAINDSPVAKVFGLLMNPTSLLLVLYFSSIGWSQVLWLQKLLRVFGRGTLTKTKPGEKESSAVPAKELPFQTFECEKCKMEMRPARGRAEAIFGRERFRCSRCGSKASAYFNVDDLSDPRAVARLERLKKEADEEGLGDEEGDEDAG